MHCEPKQLEWNYKDESDTGYVANIARAANYSWICAKLLERYRSTFVLEWGQAHALNDKTLNSNQQSNQQRAKSKEQRTKNI